MTDHATISLNGEPADTTAGETVADLLVRLGKDPRTVAVERNGAILPRDRYASTALDGGDRIEIVAFVQGGS